MSDLSQDNLSCSLFRWRIVTSHVNNCTGSLTRSCVNDLQVS